MENSANLEDFEYFSDNSYFVHKPSEFMLDGDYVLLFEDEQIINLFKAATTSFLTKDVLESMRDIVRENEQQRV